jgi:hypothetical protein
MCLDSKCHISTLKFSNDCINSLPFKLLRRKGWRLKWKSMPFREKKKKSYQLFLKKKSHRNIKHFFRTFLKLN